MCESSETNIHAVWRLIFSMNMLFLANYAIDLNKIMFSEEISIGLFMQEKICKGNYPVIICCYEPYPILMFCNMQNDD